MERALALRSYHPDSPRSTLKYGFHWLYKIVDATIGDFLVVLTYGLKDVGCHILGRFGAGGNLPTTPRMPVGNDRIRKARPKSMQGKGIPYALRNWGE